MHTNEILCITKDKNVVYFDPIKSHAAIHFADTQNLKELVIEVLESRVIAENKLEFDIDMGKIIGTTDVVDTEDNDDIIYALRRSRAEQGYVPFVKQKEPQGSSIISISLFANKDGTYQLSSAWVGAWDDPPFPQEPHATSDSVKYWESHAFVWGSQEIEPGTETKICPW